MVVAFLYGRLFVEVSYQKISRGWKLFGLLLFSWLLIVCNYHFVTWVVVPLIVVPLAIFYIKLHPSWLLDRLGRFGKISMYIFVVHPIVREVTLPIGGNTMPYWGLSIYVVISLLISFAIYCNRDRRDYLRKIITNL